MARTKPNINIPTYKKSRQVFENFVLEVIEDSFRFEFIPDEISLVDGELFVLTLTKKQFIEDTLKVDIPQDYVKIYLLSVEQPKDRYIVQQIDDNIVITFNKSITRLPQEVLKEQFRIKGRIRQVQ
jgi:hypothetical protein